MYTWGYICECALAKLDLDDNEIDTSAMLSRFHYYANEAMTQICSSVKPKKEYYTINIEDNDVGEIKEIPDADFISFGDDVCTYQPKCRTGRYVWNEEAEDYVYEKCKAICECSDEELVYKGYNKFICLKPGKYIISYNKRWFTFDSNTSRTDVLDVPNDILDCIPSYIASQCYKVDDEYKSSVFRNEYEMALARIDDTDFNNTKTFKIKGDW